MSLQLLPKRWVPKLADAFSGKPLFHALESVLSLTPCEAGSRSLGHG